MPEAARIVLRNVAEVASLIAFIAMIGLAAQAFGA
jgi:hypothetical protein